METEHVRHVTRAGIVTWAGQIDDRSCFLIVFSQEPRERDQLPAHVTVGAIENDALEDYEL